MPLPSSTKSGEVSAPRGLQRRLIFEEEEHTHAGTSVEFSAQPTTLVAATRGGIDTLSREASGTAAPTAYAPPVMGGGSGPIITEEWARSILQPGDEYFLYERHPDRYPREVDGGYASLRPGRGTAELGLAQRRAAQRRMLEGSSRQRQVIARLERDGRSPTTRGGGGGGGYMAPLVRPSPGSASNATDANNNNNSVPRWRSSPSVVSGFHRDPSCSTPPPSISAERSRQTSIVAADDVVAKDEAMMRARHVPRLFTRPSYSANALSRSASVSGGGGAITPRWLDDAYPRRASLGEEVVEVESRTATTELPHTQAPTTTTPTTPVPTTTSPPEAAGISGTTTITVAPTPTQETTTVPSTTTTTTTTTPSRFDAHDLCAKMGWTMKAVVPSNAAQEPMSVEYVAAAAAPEDVEDDDRNDGRATAPPRSPSPEAPPEVVAPPSEPVVVKVMQPPTSTSATRQVSPPRSHSHFQQQQQDAAAHHAEAEEDIEQHHHHHKHRGRMEVQPMDGGAANGLVGARYAVADPRALRQTHQARSIKLRTPMTKVAASVASPQQVSPTRRGTRGTPPPQPHPRPTAATTTTSSSSSPSTAAQRRSPPRPTTRKISNGRVVAKTPPTVAPPSYPPSRVVEPTQPILVSVMDERRAEDMLGGDGGLKSAASGASQQQQQQQQQQQLAPTAAEAAPLQQPHTSSPTSSAAEAATTSVLANTSSISGHSPSRSTSPISTSILVNVVMPAAHGSTNNHNNNHHHLLHNGGVVEVSSASMNEGATTPLSARATSLTKATLPPPITPLPRGTTSRSSSRSNSIFTGSKTLMAATEVKEDAAECVHGVMIKSVLPWLYGNPTTPSEVMMEEEEAEMIAAHEEELKDYVRGFIRTHPPPNTLVPTPTTSPSSSSPAAKEEEDGALRTRRAGLGVIHDVKRSLRLATSPNPAPELLEEDVSEAEVPLEDGSLHLHNVGYVLSVFGAAWSLTDTNIFTGQAEVCGEEVAARSEEEAKELCAARGLEILLTVPPVEEEEVVSV